ncbi:MAG: winged helix-turn-helix transcriptional regulator [Paludibacteraceae bacterium]|nr:winged helix-turn-helix transcriptional regulator [Paludibacteraceae bacterium]
MMQENLKLENQLCFRLYTASRLITQLYHPLLEPLGITYPQYLVLLVLWEQDNMPVNDIAHRLFLETNTVTPLLQRMEKMGLIKRKVGENDSRQRIVSLTEKGVEMQEKAKDIPTCMANKVMCNINETQQLIQLIPLLDNLINAIK